MASRMIKVSPALTVAPTAISIFQTIALSSDRTVISAITPARVCLAHGML